MQQHGFQMASNMQSNKKGCGKILLIGFAGWFILNVIISIPLIFIVIRPALSDREHARYITCTNNLKQIGISLMLYADDNNHNYPKTNECREILKRDYLNEKTLSCPCGGEYRFFVNGQKADKLENPNNTAIAICPNKHYEYAIILFADGHVESVKKEEMPQDQRTSLPVLER